MKMNDYNILFITSHPIDSNSSSSIRNKNLILGFLKKKIKVTLVCPKSNKDSVCEFGKYSNIDFKTYIINTNLKKIKITKTSKRFYLFRYFIEAALRFYRKFSILKMPGQSLKYADCIDFDGRRYDLVITSSDPIASHLFFKKIRHKILYDKWCQYWGDPLAYDITNKTLLPFFYRKYYESRILKAANTIVYVSPFTLEMQKKIFPNLNKKMYFIPPATRNAILYNKTVYTKNIFLSYTGGYNSIVRDIKPLYNAISKNNNIKLVISGSTDIVLEPKKNIIINNTISLDEVKKIEDKSHLIVVIMNKLGTQIPSKLYYTASTNKDILVLVNNERDSMAEYLKQFDRYDICLNNENKILNYLNTLDKEELGKRKPLTSLLPENIAERFLNLNNL